MSKSTICVAAAWLTLLALALPADAQQPTPPPRSIRGRVVAAADGSALARARLVVNMPDRPAEPVLTDDEGLFLLPVPASATGSSIRLSAAKPGFASTTTDVPVNGRDVTIALARGAAINGRVVDRNGEPVGYAMVSARADAVNPGAALPPMVTDTDDLGEYRIGGLPEGRYTVTVLGTPAAERDALARFNRRLQQDPNAALPEPASAAATVTLRAGEEADGVELVNTTRPTAVPAPPDNLPDDQKGTGTVSGRVTSSAGRPLTNAVVRLSRNAMIARFASTDAEGRYTLRGIPAGAFAVQASKTGHVSREYGQQGVAAGRTVSLRDGATVERIDIVLPGGSTISGTVVDDRGEPLQGVMVQALQLRTAGDVTMAVTAPGVGQRPTDDRGRFRLFGLLPGAHIIAAAADADVSSPDPATAIGYTPIYYPGTPDIAAAAPIRIEAGVDMPGMNLVFIPSRTARMSGIALDAAGRPARAVLVFASQRSSQVMLEPRMIQAGPDGTFSVPNVAPGEYTVQVIAPGGRPAGTGGTPGIDFGMQYVTVADGDPAPLTIRASSGVTVEGRIVADGGGSVDDVRVFAFPTDFDRSPVIGSGPAGLTMLGEGHFSITGVTGPRRFILQGAPDGWYLKSATVNGADALDTPYDFGLEARALRDVEIVVSPAGATLSGRAVDTSSAPLRDYSVLVFSTDRPDWYRLSQRLKAARPNQDGTFSVTGLPPGDYWAIAIHSIDISPSTGGWQDPEFLESLARRAQRLALGAGETRTVSLRMSDR